MKKMLANIVDNGDGIAAVFYDNGTERIPLLTITRQGGVNWLSLIHI